MLGVQDRKDAGLSTYYFLLLIDVQKAYDAVWRDGLWKNYGKLRSEEGCGEEEICREWLKIDGMCSKCRVGRGFESC